MPRIFKYRWVCEFCFRAIHNRILPAKWNLVYSNAVCPKCIDRVKRDGGYFVVKGGAYAGARRDPRALPRAA